MTRLVSSRTLPPVLAVATSMPVVSVTARPQALAQEPDSRSRFSPSPLGKTLSPSCAVAARDAATFRGRSGVPNARSRTEGLSAERWLRSRSALHLISRLASPTSSFLFADCGPPVRQEGRARMSGVWPRAARPVQDNPTPVSSRRRSGKTTTLKQAWVERDAVDGGLSGVPLPALNHSV